MTNLVDIELFIYLLFSVFFVGFVVSRLFEMLSAGGKSMSARYAEMTKPAWKPPGWVFSVAWLILYTLQTYAFYRIRLLGSWVSGTNLTELVLFVVLQFLLALFGFFFNLSLFLTVLQVFVSLVLSIVVLVLFWSLDLVAGLVLIPLVIWLLFALVLQIFISTANAGPGLAARIARSQAAPGSSFSGGGGRTRTAQRPARR